MHRSNIVYKWKQSKIDMDYVSVEFDLRRQQSWMMDLFLKNMQVFTSQDVNWWTGVMWIIVMFLSAVWTLILTAPIHYKGSISEQLT